MLTSFFARDTLQHRQKDVEVVTTNLELQRAKNHQLLTEVRRRFQRPVGPCPISDSGNVTNRDLPRVSCQPLVRKRCVTTAWCTGRDAGETSATQPGMVCLPDDEGYTVGSKKWIYSAL